MQKKKWIYLFLISVFSFHFGNAQTPTSSVPQSAPSANAQGLDTPNDEVNESAGVQVKILNAEPNKKRIRRQLNLIAGVKHDEEFLIPNVPLNFKGNVDFLDIQRIKDTDIFRITPNKVGNGIITVHNKRTGQILVEVRFDIRDQGVEKVLREVQALLSDIEGIEYKVVNGKVLLDGYVLLPKDLKRISNVMMQFLDSPVQVTSLVTLSPLARKKIVEYISREINNPEVTITLVGDIIKLEGFVNSEDEKKRIAETVAIYFPEPVVEKMSESVKNINYFEKRPQPSIESYIVNLIQVRRDENKVEPPPKMIQIVIHVVEYAERYLKGFTFTFSPSLSTLGAAQGQGQTQAPGSISELASIIDNLLPKLNWARNHGYARLLDTASILAQDKGSSANPTEATLDRTFNVNNGNTTINSGPSIQSYKLRMVVTPIIKSERSELVEMAVSVDTSSAGNGPNSSMFGPVTTVKTKVSVRSRQSAALAGIISKKSENAFGGPTGAGAIVTLNHGKNFIKASSNYVLFVTPIIKASASAGVEQVKKKFRFKE